MSDRESDAIDEELTAYLDGELTPQESAALEQRLVEDEFLRTRLAELRKAYDLLDELPETPHSKNFTQTTIEMVIADIKRSGTRDAVDSKQSAQVQSSVDWSRRWFTFPYALVPLAVSLLIGSLIGISASAYRTSRELGALDLASNLPGLHDVGDLQILQELAKDQKLIGYLQEHYRDAIIPPVPVSSTERVTWVRGLNTVQTAKLSSARELLGKYPPDVRQRLEAIQTQINTQPSPQELNLTAKMVG
ncbi:MAG: anti-sigma factor family protein, partial [Pirellula sp.]